MQKSVFTGLIASVVFTAAMPSPATAAVIVNVVQSGSDVIATASGSLDLTGLANTGGTFSLSQGVFAATAYIGLGNQGVDFTGYSGLLGPKNFGSGKYFSGSTNSGTGFAINGTELSVPYVFVPLGFLSGGLISGTETFAGQTFASLGLQAGQFAFSSASDSVTVNIGPPMGAVPEPATWALMLLGFGGIGVAMRRRRQSNTVQTA